MLVRKGAKLDLQNGSYQATALLLASGRAHDPKADHLGVVKVLLQAGANPRMADKNNLTPLMCAATYDRADIIAVLARYGLDLKSPQGDGAMTFAESVKQKHPHAVKALLDAGVDPNLQVDANYPALIYAIEMRNIPIVQILVAAKANVNVTCRQPVMPSGSITYSPLIIAANRASAPYVELLLQAGANPAYKDSLGHTSLDYARANKDSRIIALLEAAGPKR